VAIDSTAELIFNITANADEAGENITRFRALMGQNIEGMASQLKDWADQTIGEIDSVKAAMTAGVAAIAAGLVAVTALVGEASKEYTKYTDEVSRAMKLTGASAEDMSTLHEAAAQTGTDFGTLTNGLVKFEQAIVKGSSGSNAQSKAFATLGISQADVIAGQKNMLPLLMRVMDGFHNNASAVQKAALAKDLFTRSGPELINFLSKGSEWLKEMRAEADELHITLTTKNIDDAREFTQTQRKLNAEMEGVNITIGNQTQGLRTWWATFETATLKFLTDKKYFAEYRKAWKDTVDEIAKSVQSLKTNIVTGDHPAGSVIPPDTVPKIKEAKQEFGGLVTLVESLKSKIAEQGTPWDRLANEVLHYHVEIDKTTAELGKLQKAGKVTPESLQQSQAALAQIPTLLAKVITDTTAKLNAEETQRWGEAIQKSFEAEDKLAEEQRQAGERRIEVTREIVDKEATEEERGYAGQRAALARQMNAWAASLAKKTELTAEDWNAIDRITAEGLAKIDQTQTTAWQQELVKLQEHLDRAAGENASEKQKLFLTYQKDLEQYSQVEEQKTLKTAQGNEQRAQIEQTYALVRAQITQKYQDDLQKLLNSQGFQGLFGTYFSNLIRSNQDLLRQWSTSANQSILMVKMSLQSLKDMSQQTFQTFVQGMGQTIATALVAKTSIAQAMEAMLKSTIESFAGQAIVAAIMATAWGFYWLMLQNYSAAGQAFTSAAIFGSVGAAAAVAGSFMPSSSQQGGAGAPSKAGGTSGAAGSSAGAAAGSGGAASQQPTVYVNVEGHVIGPSGISQLIDMINQGVYGNSMQLYATHNPAGKLL